MYRDNQKLEQRDWEYCIKQNKTRIQAIIMLVQNNNPQGYKEHYILFIAFTFGEDVTVIDWLVNMKLHVFHID